MDDAPLNMRPAAKRRSEIDLCLRARPRVGDRQAIHVDILRHAGVRRPVHSDRIIDRLPDIHLSGDVQRLRSNFINGVKHIPVGFTPSAPVGR